MSRVLAIARTHLAGEWMGERGARLPVAPVLFQAFLTAVLCGLVRSELPPLAYGIFALAIPLGLTSLTLFGDLAPLLRADPAAEWIGSQPVRAVELRAARVIVVGVLLGGLALGSLLPAAALAPAEMGLEARALLVAVGLAQTLFVAVVLLGLHHLFAERAEGVLVALQTAVFALVLVGFVAGLGQLPALAATEAVTGAWLAFPPAWFAEAAVGPRGTGSVLALGALAATLVTLAAAPFPRAPRARRTATPLSVLLHPLRLLARRVWVRGAERASFELVYEALPTERAFVARTYPLFAVPLSFLVLGAEGGTEKGEALLALLAFAPVVYLPILLLHVSATATPEARWIVDVSPVDPAAESRGARKAFAVRFLVPLYAALALLVALRGDVALAARLVPVAAAAGLLLLRVGWPAWVTAAPLSTAAGDLGTVWDEVGSEGGSTGGILVVAIGGALLALLTWHLVPGPVIAFGLLALALAAELVPGARRRR